MRSEDLPLAQFAERNLRTVVARVVSDAQEQARNAGGLHPVANQLVALFTAANAGLAALVEVDTPDVVSLTQTFADKVIVVLFDKDLDPAYVPAVADLSITSPSRTVTGVAVSGRRLLVTYEGTTLVTADSPALSYTQVAATAIRDFAGLKASDFVASAVTVAGA